MDYEEDPNLEDTSSDLFGDKYYQLLKGKTFLTSEGKLLTAHLTDFDNGTVVGHQSREHEKPNHRLVFEVPYGNTIRRRSIFESVAQGHNEKKVVGYWKTLESTTGKTRKENLNISDDDEVHLKITDVIADGGVLVQWVGYSEEEATIEDAREIDESNPQLICDFCEQWGVPRQQLGLDKLWPAGERLAPFERGRKRRAGCLESEQTSEKIKKTRCFRNDSESDLESLNSLFTLEDDSDTDEPRNHELVQESHYTSAGEEYATSTTPSCTPFSSTTTRSASQLGEFESEQRRLNEKDMRDRRRSKSPTQRADDDAGCKNVVSNRSDTVTTLVERFPAGDRDGFAVSGCTTNSMSGNLRLHATGTIAYAEPNETSTDTKKPASTKEYMRASKLATEKWDVKMEDLSFTNELLQVQIDDYGRRIQILEKHKYDQAVTGSVENEPARSTTLMGKTGNVSLSGGNWANSRAMPPANDTTTTILEALRTEIGEKTQRILHLEAANEQQMARIAYLQQEVESMKVAATQSQAQIHNLGRSFGRMETDNAVSRARLKTFDKGLVSTKQVLEDEVEKKWELMEQRIAQEKDERIEQSLILYRTMMAYQTDYEQLQNSCNEKFRLIGQFYMDSLDRKKAEHDAMLKLIDIFPSRNKNSTPYEKCNEDNMNVTCGRTEVVKAVKKSTARNIDCVVEHDVSGLQDNGNCELDELAPAYPGCDSLERGLRD